MADVLTDTIELVVRKQTYVFKVPTVAFDLEVGYRAMQIRQRIAPQTMGGLYGLDNAAATTSRNFAIMELYLLRASDPWPFTAASDGKPVVDSSKFPLNKTNTIYEIGLAFEGAYSRFRDDGTGDGEFAGDQAVAGLENPGAP